MTQTLCERLGFALPPSVINVDYRRDLRVLVEELQCFVNNALYSCTFQVDGEEGVVECECKLFHFDEGVTIPKALKLIEADTPTHPWRGASLRPLLAFSKKFPREQCSSPILALGARGEWEGREVIPYISFTSYRVVRRVDISFSTPTLLHPPNRVLAIRKARKPLPQIA